MPSFLFVRIRTSLLLLCAFTLMGSACAQAQDPSSLSKYQPRLERNLKENIVPFWIGKTLDTKNGGYVLNHDMKGNLLQREATKMIVTQARQVWLFSRLVRAGYGGKEYLEAADLGYRFLRDRMWDVKNGGFYWEVDVTGEKHLNPRKHLYGQAFALYGLSEYYLAGQKKEALDLAVRLFNLLEAKSHDNTYGGYIEYFNEDWTTPPPDENSPMGLEPNLKLMNTHLHLLEAMTTFYRASKLPLARERLLELIGIETDTVVRKGLGACTDQYDRNWKPRLEGERSRVSYGHDIENVWLLVDACNAAGVSCYPHLDLFRSLWAYALKYGFDEEKGGIFNWGPFNQPASNRDKSWWAQAEVLVSSLRMYLLTRDQLYLTIFERTYNFIERYFVDSQGGEWFENVRPNGQPSGGKAHAWKAGYHNGRSMIECIQLIKEINRK